MGLAVPSLAVATNGAGLQKGLLLGKALLPPNPLPPEVFHYAFRGVILFWLAFIFSPYKCGWWALEWSCNRRRVGGALRERDDT